MHLSTIFLLVFLNMIFDHCASEYFENHFILVTHIRLNMFRGFWKYPFYRTEGNTEEVEKACKALKTLPIFEMNPTNLSFLPGQANLYFENTQVPQYAMFLNDNRNSEIVEKLSNLQDDKEIIYTAVRCTWGKSFVYIAMNEKIESSLILFIRHEYFGLKVLGLTSPFLEMQFYNSNDVIQSFYENFNSKNKEQNKQARKVWSHIMMSPVYLTVSLLSHQDYPDVYFKNFQNLIWQLCASVYYNLKGQTEEIIKLKCSFQQEMYKKINSKKILNYDTLFHVLQIENELPNYKFKYDLILHAERNNELYIIDNNDKTVLLCKLTSKITIPLTNQKNTYLDEVIIYNNY